MTERGMIFNAEMVRAILDGRKIQTRRILKNQPAELPSSPVSITRTDTGFQWYANDGVSSVFSCPFGQPGDRIWVRETWAMLGNEDRCPIDWNENVVKDNGPDAARIYRASCTQGDYGLWQIPDDADWKPHTDSLQYDGAWTPSIHMPRWASRLTLEITNVGVQPLQSISQNDAAREGLVRLPASGRYCINQGDQYFGGASHDAREVFSWLWSSIYGEESWQANPWVWVIEFRRVEGEAV